MSCACLTRHALRTSPLPAIRPGSAGARGVHALQASRRLLILLQLTHVVASTDGQYRAGAAAAQCKNPRRHVWRRSHRMPDNAALVDQMVTEGWLTDQRCIDVMKRVDRKDYVHPATPTSEIYEGSGYLTACFGLLVQPGGFAVGIERNEALTEMSKENLQESIPELMQGNSAVVVRSGNILGALQSDGTHFDAIHVGAAAATLPKQVCDLLAKDGLMMVPVGPRGGAQVLSVVKKTVDENGEESLEISKCGQVQYVPLTTPDMDMSAV